MKSGLRGALLSAIVSIGIFAGSNANAAGTDAGTAVQNTFTLNYDVNSTAQPPITNDGVGPNPGPTTFTVDRLVDLTVSAVDNNGGTQGTEDATPGATGEQLIWGVRNDGNDTQAYSLALENVVDDDFGTLTSTVIYVDNGDGIFNAADDIVGPGTPYTPGSGDATGDVLEDQTIWVVATYSVAAGAANGALDEVTLLADTLDPVTWSVEGASTTAGDETVAETGANNLLGVAQNVLADGAGPSTNDNPTDGSGSATAGLNITAADLSATKTVNVIATDGSSIDCALDGVVAGNQYAVPGACIEYVITAVNAASAAQTATNIDISDFLPYGTEFVGATQATFTAAGTLVPASAACTETDAPPAVPDECEVQLNDATLDPGETGTLTIRALVR